MVPVFGRGSRLLFPLLVVLALLAPIGAAGTTKVSAKLGSRVEGNPVAKVVKLLNEMQATIQREGEEDEEMYDKLSCWCTTNDKDKTDAIEQAEATISELESSIEELSATITALEAGVKKTQEELADDTNALNEASELRKKQQEEFHGYELDAIQNVENLKAAIVVLGKHHAAAFPQIAIAPPAAPVLLQESAQLRASVRAHTQQKAGARGDLDHETRELNMFMLRSSFDTDLEATPDSSVEADKATEAFLKKNDGAGTDQFGQAFSSGTPPSESPSSSGHTDISLLSSGVSYASSEESDSGEVAEVAHPSAEYTAEEVQILRKARRGLLAYAPRDRLEALGLVQTYLPSEPYAAQSGEILGMLKQMKETMEGKLTEAQATEKDRVAEFAALRAAKEEEIAEAEKVIESKTAELSLAGQNHAQAKEDLDDTQANLEVDKKFLVNLRKMCKEADEQWAIRRKTRAEEARAIMETIGILTEDEARDTMNRSLGDEEGAAALIQRAAIAAYARIRRKAAACLRSKADASRSDLSTIGLATLASTVQLDAFTEVKKAMDDMITDLKTQQEDEVTKHDYCNAGLQENEMTTMKTEDVKKDLEMKLKDIEASIEELHNGIKAAKAGVVDTQVNQQRANENRVKENQDFQRTISDQQATVEILHKALNRLAQFYDAEELLQTMKDGGGTSGGHKKQQPPVPLDGAGYSKSGGSGGVMSMIEKLIQDAQELQKEARTDEQAAQRDYEEFTADSSDTLKKLSEEIVNKFEAVSQREKEKVETEESLQSSLAELEGLAKEAGTLHKECDFLIKNFDIRQKARVEEIQSIQQAKQILSGAM